jgi:hypothetical protein
MKENQTPAQNVFISKIPQNFPALEIDKINKNHHYIQCCNKTEISNFTNPKKNPSKNKANRKSKPT